MAAIMVIEDEPAISDLLALNLKLVGHTAFCCGDGSEAVELIKNINPDLILLDIMIPGKDGFELMKEINPFDIPVIFLTAKESIDDKVTGLRLGAEDYIVKPFATIEVLTRIDTVLKRCKKSGIIFRFANLEVRLEERTVYLNGGLVELTTKEFELLEVLIRNKNIALSRNKLLELIWGFDYTGETRTVDVHIQKLRSKLELEDKIKTVYKVGYRLEVHQ